MIRYLELNGKEYPFKFGFSAFMRVKSDMSELESVVCICFHAIRIAAKKVNPTLLNDTRFKDLETFADEIFADVVENQSEIDAIAEAIQQAQGNKDDETKKKAVKKSKAS